MTTRGLEQLLRGCAVALGSLTLTVPISYLDRIQGGPVVDAVREGVKTILILTMILATLGGLALCIRGAR